MTFASIHRRSFITLLGGAAATWPLAARAQQPAMPVVGFFHLGSPETRATFLAAFRQGLREAGYVEGQNIKVEYHWAREQYDRLPEMAADLVRRQVSVIVTPASSGPTVAAMAATTTIPIIFGIGDDPVKLGFVASFNRPGGNATGVSYFTNELGPKRLGLLHELLPAAAAIAVLVNSNSPVAESGVRDVQAAADTIGRQIEILYATNNREIDSAFTALAQKKAAALLVIPDSVLTSRRVQIVTLATRDRLAAIYPAREWPEIGGMMSYGASVADVYRQVGVYAGRILKGEKPADLPVARPTRFEFVIKSNALFVLVIIQRLAGSKCQTFTRV